MSEHYFTQEPVSRAEHRRIGVVLGGQEAEVVTAGGVFSPEHVDTGTRVLLDTVPEPVPGDLLDLGCGWGPIALDAGLRAREAGTPVTVWALDVNARALELTRTNARALGLEGPAGEPGGSPACVRAVTEEQVPAEVRFTQIWSNPPIRVGKAVLHGMLREWLPRLAPGGAAHLVVAKKLGADSLLRWLDDEDGAGLGPEFTAARVGNSRGFRVIRVDRAG
ncbi:class I SAM-dependent methyltransferase [Brevibacterium album]|uniref:class I SAM-dependent methyltransferase n=1 Tax=Brevibacterium album TaxID=417948 RepID=UPI0003F7DA1A|nr:methyltransferase [Brevibacterium album]